MVVMICTGQQVQIEQIYAYVFVKAAIKISTAEPSPLLNIVIISAECKSEQEEEARKTFRELLY